MGLGPVELGDGLAIWLSMEERRRLPDRRRNRNSRRAGDPQSDHTANNDLRREVAGLRTVIEALVDVIQKLTATLNKPHL